MATTMTFYTTDKTGTLSDLTTTDKSSFVNAINEVNDGTVHFDKAQTLNTTEQDQAFSNLGGAKGTGYTKFPDGTMVQWGSLTVTATFSQIESSGIYWSGTQTITFPQAFTSTSFTVTGSSRYSTGHILSIGAVPASTTTATVCAYDFYARTSTVIYWTAVGRWR